MAPDIFVRGFLVIQPEIRVRFRDLVRMLGGMSEQIASFRPNRNSCGRPVHLVPVGINL